MNERQALEVVHKMLVAWPRLSLEKEQIRFFAEQLLDLPAEPTIAALTRLARSNTFPPSLAELRQTTYAVLNGETAQTAWQQIMESLQAAGSGSIDFPPSLSDLARSTLEAIGGYHRLRMTDAPQYMQKDFEATYQRRQTLFAGQEFLGLTGGQNEPAIGEGGESS